MQLRPYQQHCQQLNNGIIMNIYTMELHGTLKLGNLEIFRVAGGWIYNFINVDGKTPASVFIPYNNEFQTKCN